MLTKKRIQQGGKDIHEKKTKAGKIEKRKNTAQLANKEAYYKRMKSKKEMERIGTEDKQSRKKMKNSRKEQIKMN